MRPFLLFCFISFCLLAPSLPAEVFDGAEWLRDPVFEGVPIREWYGREKDRVKETDTSGLRNVHTLFRKEITLKDAPHTALLTITGDDYYKFSINGYRVVQGPESGYPYAHPYYYLDVSSFLEAGPNTLSAHAYYQGLVNRVWDSGDNRSGFMMSLEVSYADGSNERFSTDASWRCFQLQAFQGVDTIGYATQFIENIDMRLLPRGWEYNGFDDGAWIDPLVERQDHRFALQQTPPLQVTTMKPASTKNLGAGRYFYDFGTEIVGHTRVRLRGNPGDVVTIRHGEELSAPNEVRYAMRANCTYEERAIMSGEEDVIAFYDYRAFRYIEILDALAEPELWVEVRHHPFDASESSFRSSDKEMERVWDICRNGVQMGSQGGFLDCPSREKGQYLGDAVITSRSHLWLTADPSLTRKSLHDFQLSSHIHEGLMACAPGNFMQEIAEYSLQYPLWLENYYQHSGDRVLTDRIATDTLPPLFEYFARFENSDGLISGMSEKWVLVDWPANLRDDYDYNYAKERANTVLNAFYYGALRSAASLERQLGREGTAYDARADRVRDAFAKVLADPDTGLYFDAPGSKHRSLHANAIPLFFGLTGGANRDTMLELIRNKKLNCGVYIASYVIEACFKQGEGDLAYSLLTSSDEHSWKEMLRHGATACMEVWGPDQKRNTSWCHPWSSSPIYLIAEYVFGLKPGAPGWEKIRIAPVKINNLPAARLVVPIPQGKITAIYEKETGFTVFVPPGVPVEILAPEGVQVVVNEASTTELTPGDHQRLNELGWNDRVGAASGVWVDIARQRLLLIEKGQVTWHAPAATASAGTGFKAGSLQTPLGWHRVAAKIGEDAPWGQVFRSRAPSKEVWKPGQDLSEDLVLTRVLWLDGDEAGRNRGRDADGTNVDSKERCIYIHGTNDEARIGTPSSHGCIRLLNDDVIELFNRVPEDTPVLITDS